MQLLNNLYQYTNDYYQDIPVNTGKQIIRAAGVGFIIMTVISGDPLKGLTVAALSGVTTLVYGLVTPLFKSFLNHPPALDKNQELCRLLTAIISVGCAASALGMNNKILQALPFYAFAWSLMTSDETKIDSTRWMLLFPN